MGELAVWCIIYLLKAGTLASGIFPPLLMKIHDGDVFIKQAFASACGLKWTWAQQDGFRNKKPAQSNTNVWEAWEEVKWENLPVFHSNSKQKKDKISWFLFIYIIKFLFRFSKIIVHLSAKTTSQEWTWNVEWARESLGWSERAWFNWVLTQTLLSGMKYAKPRTWLDSLFRLMEPRNREIRTSLFIQNLLSLHDQTEIVFLFSLENLSSSCEREWECFGESKQSQVQKKDS